MLPATPVTTHKTLRVRERERELESLEAAVRIKRDQLYG